MIKQNHSRANLGFERELWQTADALRSNMDAAENKHMVLDLIFLKHISNAFEEQHTELQANHATGADKDNRWKYEVISSFSKSASIDDISAHGHVLTPGCYVGTIEVEDDNEPFDEKMKRLTTTLKEQNAQASQLDQAIWKNLKELGYGV